MTSVCTGVLAYADAGLLDGPAGCVTEPPRLDGRNINRNRALLIRWSRKPENHLALLQLACGLIGFKKAPAARLAHALPG